MTIINDNPVVYESAAPIRPIEPQEYNEEHKDDLTALEVFDLIKNINDPEHPLTLEQLNVVRLNHTVVEGNNVSVEFTPTIPHCSMATLIGLSIRVKLQRSLPPRMKISVAIRPGTHQSEDAVNKQLKDKERVSAALENRNLAEIVNQCLSTSLQ